MSSFEESLSKALEKKNPSPEFAMRVMAAVARDKRHPGGFWSARWKAVWLAPLAATLLLTTGVAYEQYHKREQGLLAKDKLVFALKLTGEKLHQAQERVAVVSEGIGAQR